MSALATKIAAASKDVGGKLSADKRNTDQNYNYLSSDKIVAECGQALAEQGVTVYPSITGHEITMLDRGSNKSARYDATVNYAMTVSDGETEFMAAWVGLGSDYLVPDKALYKAITSGHRYFLAKLLNVGAGNEDGEHENEPTGLATQTPKATPPAKTNGTNGTAHGAPDDDGADEFERIPTAQQERAAATAPDTYSPTCPVCDGPVWDNRKDKRNPKAPDFKCRDKDCGGAIWLPESIEKGRAAMFAASKKVYSDTDEGKAAFAAWVKSTYGVASRNDLTLTQLAEIAAILKHKAEAQERQEAAA